MTCKKILFPVLMFMLSTAPCFAEGYMSVKLGATAQFVYVQVIDVINGHLSLRMDVTGQVPYTVQTVDNEKTLVIN